MAKVEPRFLECKDCKFYSKARVYPRCLRCGVGEYFEERQDDYEPSEEELMQIYRKMDRDDE